MTTATDKPPRIIVDPAVSEAEQNFHRMMVRIRAETLEGRIRWQIERGFMNADGSWKLPEGDPCVTRVDAPSPTALERALAGALDQARAAGKHEGMRAALVLQLRKKFGDLDDDTLQRIEAANGLAIEYWLERILCVTTLAAVFPFQASDPTLGSRPDLTSFESPRTMTGRSSATDRATTRARARLVRMHADARSPISHRAHPQRPAAGPGG